MSSYWSKVIPCVLVFLSWDSTHPVLAASKFNEQPVTTELSAALEDCQISDEARNAIDAATNAWMKAGNVPEALELILQAEAATEPPDCDNTKAVELATRAKQWAEKDSTTPKSSTVRYKSVSAYNPFAYPNCDFSGRMEKEWKVFF